MAHEFQHLCLHDALPISKPVMYVANVAENGFHNNPFLAALEQRAAAGGAVVVAARCSSAARNGLRSEEHTSELQSHANLVCRLLLEKKKRARISRNGSTI